MVKAKMSMVVANITKSARRPPNVPKATVRRVVGSASTDLQRIMTNADAIPTTRGGWKVAHGLKHLVEADSRFGPIIVAHGVPTSSGYSTASTALNPHDAQGDHYLALLNIIIYQQLSAKSAEPIFNRFVAAFKLKPGVPLDPKTVSTAKFESTLVDGKRKILLNGSISGLSESKAKYIADLTEHFLDPDRLQGVDLTAISDEELRAKLIAVKGLGPWSVDMFMLFNLQRQNVLPVGDLVVRKGIAHFFGYTEKYFENTKNQALIPELCKTWAPYSSLATHYMWSTMASVQPSPK